LNGACAVCRETNGTVTELPDFWLDGTDGQGFRVESRVVLRAPKNQQQMSYIALAQ